LGGVGEVGREHFHVYGLVQAKMKTFVDRTVFFDGYAGNQMAVATPLSDETLIPIGWGFRDAGQNEIRCSASSAFQCNECPYPSRFRTCVAPWTVGLRV
jgi:hypothetical protein